MFSPKDIPNEILFDILARCPVKSLLNFRCVCKSWHALISSPSFISAYFETNAMKSGYDYFLVHTGDSLSVVCPETYATSLELDLTPPHESDSSFSIYGSCNGLFCISDHTMKSIYLWNPSIRKFKRLPKGSIYCKHHVALGFGLHANGSDYKVVRIVRLVRRSICAEIYSLKFDCWRRIRAVPPVTYTAKWSMEWAYLNGVAYWIVEDSFPGCKCIISFDVDNEVFQRIMPPDTLLKEEYTFFSSKKEEYTIRVLEKSLSVLHRRIDCYPYFYDIWVLEMDSWKMIHSIPLRPGQGTDAFPLGFTTNGGVHFSFSGKLALYDQISQQFRDTGLEVWGRRTYDYSESLILLN